jgi:hypothetical protein
MHGFLDAPSKVVGAPAHNSISLVDILRLEWAESCQGGLSSGNSLEDIELELKLSSISVGIRWGSASAISRFGAT